MVTIPSASNQTEEFLINQVLYSPLLKFNLLSIPQLAAAGIVVQFNGKKATMSKSGRIIGIAEMSSNSLYQIKMRVLSHTSTSCKGYGITLVYIGQKER